VQNLRAPEKRFGITSSYLSQSNYEQHPRPTPCVVASPLDNARFFKKKACLHYFHPLNLVGGMNDRSYCPMGPAFFRSPVKGRADLQPARTGVTRLSFLRAAWNHTSLKGSCWTVDGVAWTCPRRRSPQLRPLKHVSVGPPHGCGSKPTSLSLAGRAGFYIYLPNLRHHAKAVNGRATKKHARVQPEIPCATKPAPARFLPAAGSVDQ